MTVKIRDLWREFGEEDIDGDFEALGEQLTVALNKFEET